MPFPYADGRAKHGDEEEGGSPVGCKLAETADLPVANGNASAPSPADSAAAADGEHDDGGASSGADGSAGAGRRLQALRAAAAEALRPQRLWDRSVCWGLQCPPVCCLIPRYLMFCQNFSLPVDGALVAQHQIEAERFNVENMLEPGLLAAPQNWRLCSGSCWGRRCDAQRCCCCSSGSPTPSHTTGSCCWRRRWASFTPKATHKTCYGTDN